MVPLVQRWIGIFFVTSAELGGSRMAGLLSGMAFASIVLGLLVGPAAFGAAAGPLGLVRRPVGGLSPRCPRPLL